MSVPKKTFALGFSTILAVAMVGGVWFYLNRDTTEIYSAKSQKTPFLAASAGEPRKELTEWEEEILSRKPNTTAPSENYTENVSKAFLEELYKVRQANAAIDEKAIAKLIIDQNSPKNKKIDYKQYSISDLTLTAKNDANDFKRYGNALGAASIKNTYTSASGNEFEILSRAMELNRDDEFVYLDPIIKNYEQLIADLLAIETPATLAPIHLEIINSLSQITAAVSQFKLFFKDPFWGLFVTTSYAGFGADLKNHMKDLHAVLIEKGVRFEADESGFVIEQAATASVKNQ